MNNNLFNVMIQFAMVEKAWTYNGTVHLCLNWYGFAKITFNAVALLSVIMQIQHNAHT